LALAKGELDEKRFLSREWALQTGGEDFNKQNVKVNGVDWGYNYIGWNQRPVPDAPFFKDKRVRWAMAYAFNHKEMLEKISFNLLDPGASIYHPESWMANPEVKPIQQDLDKAEAMLDEAGWTDSDGDGVRDKTIDGKNVKFDFTMEVPVGGTGEAVATLMKEDLETIGVKMTIKTLEWATFSQNQQEHKSQAFAAAWGTGTDPDSAKNLWKTEEYTNGRNYVGYSNLEVDKAFDEGAKPMDREGRRPYYQKIHKLIADDQPYLFLTFRRALWCFNKRLRGYNFSPRDVFRYNPGPLAIWAPKQP
jgi:peptide/nickel transport system substrate-binding protein